MFERSPLHKQRGVSLIEIVIIIIVLGVVATPFSDGFISVSKSFSVDIEVLQSNAYAQSCAEHILYLRRAGGYAGLVNTDCDDLPNPAGLVKTVTIASASGDAACASGDCKSIEIVVTSGGQTRANISFLLMN